VAGNPNNIRLGHALRMSDAAWDNNKDLTEITKEAFRLAAGKEALVARAPAPHFRLAVEHAERQIGIDPHDPNRPVYAYIGDLHAHLGQVGLVFDRGWARRCLHGFTQCDSGGMVGAFGNFQYAVESNVAAAEGKKLIGEAEKSVKEAEKRVKAAEAVVTFKTKVHSTWQALAPDATEVHTSLLEAEQAGRELATAQQDVIEAKARVEGVKRDTKPATDEAQGDRDRAVRSITVLEDRDPTVAATLEAAFAAEVESSYPGGARDYVYSVKPNVTGWLAAHRALLFKNNLVWDEQIDDEFEPREPRQRCVSKVNRSLGKHDRRIWTWEVRMSESPRSDELLAVILSPEASKVFLNERLDLQTQELVAKASLRDVSSPSSVVSVQIGPSPAAALDDVQLVTAAANERTRATSGQEQNTNSAPWFYSDQVRDVLLGPP
jgi:hypothetical protein